MKRRSQNIIAAISISIVFSGCVTSDEYSPKENTQPIAQLHISGKKSASLSIGIVATYQAANESCDRKTNWPMTVSLPRFVQVEIPVHEMNDRYEATIQLDKFEKAYCKWLPWSVGYIVKKGDVSVTMPIPPVPLVWIATPGANNIWFAKEGVTDLTAFEVKCQEYKELEKSKLACDSPLGKRNITNMSNKVQVDFIERNWFTVPFHN